MRSIIVKKVLGLNPRKLFSRRLELNIFGSIEDNGTKTKINRIFNIQFYGTNGLKTFLSYKSFNKLLYLLPPPIRRHPVPVPPSTASDNCFSLSDMVVKRRKRIHLSYEIDSCYKDKYPLNYQSVMQPYLSKTL